MDREVGFAEHQEPGDATWLRKLVPEMTEWLQPQVCNHSIEYPRQRLLRSEPLRITPIGFDEALPPESDGRTRQGRLGDVTRSAHVQVRSERDVVSRRAPRPTSSAASMNHIHSGIVGTAAVTVPE